MCRMTCHILSLSGWIHEGWNEFSGWEYMTLDKTATTYKGISVPPPGVWQSCSEKLTQQNESSPPDLEWKRRAILYMGANTICLRTISSLTQLWPQTKMWDHSFTTKSFLFSTVNGLNLQLESFWNLVSQMQISLLHKAFMASVYACKRNEAGGGCLDQALIILGYCKCPQSNAINDPQLSQIILKGTHRLYR